MGRVIVLLAVANLVFLALALVDCLSVPGEGIRGLPRGLWVLVIVLTSPIGGTAWYLAGRPLPDPAPADRPVPVPPRPLAPDDDPEFLRGLSERRQRETDRRLRAWEEDLRRREQRLRPDADGGSGSSDPAAEPKPPEQAPES